MTNFDLESAWKNSNLKYPKKYSLPKLVEEYFEHFGFELIWNSFNMKSTKEDYITKSLVTDSIGVIMIGCSFIQTDEMTIEGQKGFIYTHEVIFATDTE